MLDQFAELGIIFVILALLASLVRYERRLNRWLQKGASSCRKPLILEAMRRVRDCGDRRKREARDQLATL